MKFILWNQNSENKVFCCCFRMLKQHQAKCQTYLALSIYKIAKIFQMKIQGKSFHFFRKPTFLVINCAVLLSKYILKVKLHTLNSKKLVFWKKWKIFLVFSFEKFWLSCKLRPPDNFDIWLGAVSAFWNNSRKLYFQSSVFFSKYQSLASKYQFLFSKYRYLVSKYRNLVSKYWYLASKYW